MGRNRSDVCTLLRQWSGDDRKKRIPVARTTAPDYSPTTDAVGYLVSKWIQDAPATLDPRFRENVS
ncbi:MAG: hypothetical protein ACFFFG_17310 [Candidatus Thorarchaeota archaeon]